MEENIKTLVGGRCPIEECDNKGFWGFRTLFEHNEIFRCIESSQATTSDENDKTYFSIRSI